jgi:hypothetical protein
MLQLGFGFDHKETNQTDGDLNRSPQQWQKAHNHMSHVILLQCYVGIFKIKRVQY